MTMTHTPPTPSAEVLPPPSAAVRRKRKMTALTGWLYVAPTALFVVILFLVPIFVVAQMSVSDWGLFTGNEGLNFPENFSKVIDNRFFLSSIWFTLKYTVIATVLLLALGLGLALLVQESTRWKSLMRTAFLVPSALGLASASLLFYALYSPQSSPLLPILRWLGLADENFSFLGTPTMALWSTVFLVVWRYAGFYMLLLMVGLQRIPADAYEAAYVDGANRWQIFTKITVPLLRPSLAMATVLCVTGSLLAFDQFYILTKGGPDNSTITVVQLIYNQAFAGQNNLGRAAALSVLVLLALVVINFLQLKFLKGDDD